MRAAPYLQAETIMNAHSSDGRRLGDAPLSRGGDTIRAASWPTETSGLLHRGVGFALRESPYLGGTNASCRL